MSGDESILQEVIRAEGRTVKNDPNDPMDPSKYGIGAPVLGNWRGLHRPATVAEIHALEEVEARAIYRSRYIRQPNFQVAAVPYEPLRFQLIDFGINSGPETATMYLQRLLQHVWPQLAIDGRLGPKTAEALHTAYAMGWCPIINDALVCQRLAVIDYVTDTRKGYKLYEEGLENRALSFRVTRA
jgi:lysozyme family protein